MNDKTIASIIIFVGLTATSLEVPAATFSPPMTQQAEIAFAAAPPDISIDWVPTGDVLMSTASTSTSTIGDIELGDTTILSDPNHPSIGLRISPNYPGIVLDKNTDGTSLGATVYGNNPEHSVHVTLEFSYPLVGDMIAVGNDRFMVAGGSIPFPIYQVIMKGGQFLHADTYPLSFDAVLYTP